CTVSALINPPTCNHKEEASLAGDKPGKVTLTSTIPKDVRLQDAASDVARRLCEFDQYGSEARACSALRRRAPGHPANVYDEVLRVFIELFKQTQALLRNPDFHRPLEPGQRYSAFHDIETERMTELLSV